jgi:hypothetical protein
MKRVGNLWAEVTSFENLLAAAKAAAAGKRSRRDVAAFEMDLEPELARLRRELMQGEYVSGAYRDFRVNDGKPRLISAAPFRDRVVHHALTRVLEPVSERRFSPCSFACRKGLGTHRAIKAAKAGMQRCAEMRRSEVLRDDRSRDTEQLTRAGDQVPAHAGARRKSHRRVGAGGKAGGELFYGGPLVYAFGTALRAAVGESDFAIFR